MTQNIIIDEYFNWLFDFVCENRYSKSVSFKKLLMCLHGIEFVYSVPKDQNRAEDGKDLRYRFAMTQGYADDVEIVTECLAGPCSVLEMMIALAIRCEENIMDDPCKGNRTSQWFWGMIVNLGLGSMSDTNFDKHYVTEVVNTFLNREYAPNGEGGLFTINGCEQDLRTVEIWHQLCWYLDVFA